MSITAADVDSALRILRSPLTGFAVGLKYRLLAYDLMCDAIMGVSPSPQALAEARERADACLRFGSGLDQEAGMWASVFKAIGVERP